MAGLRDIAPIKETVNVNGTAVDVIGVSADGLVYLLNSFPEIRMAMTSKKVDPDRWMKLGGKIVAAIIAAGTGNPGDAECEAIAGGMPVSVQMEFIEKIMKLTMPEGPLPFMERATALLSGGALSDTAPGTKSQKASKH